MKEAPLFVDAYDLSLRLLTTIDAENLAHPVLASRIAALTLDLLNQLTLALKGFETEAQAALADESLALLRVDLRLAMDLGLVERSLFFGVSEQLDAIGRQLGGWLKRLRTA